MQHWGGCKLFCIYDGIGMSTSSPHRESTDSLIHVYLNLTSVYRILAYITVMLSSCVNS